MTRQGNASFSAAVASRAHPPGRAPADAPTAMQDPSLPLGPSRRPHQRAAGVLLRGSRPPTSTSPPLPPPAPDRREPRLLRSLSAAELASAILRSIDRRAYLLGARSLGPVGDVLPRERTSITFCCSRAISAPASSETEGRRPCRSGGRGPARVATLPPTMTAQHAA